MALARRQSRNHPQPKAPQEWGAPTSSSSSPVHALQGSLAANWSGEPQVLPAAQKALPLSRLTTIAALAALAWAPVALGVFAATR